MCYKEISLLVLLIFALIGYLVYKLRSTPAAAEPFINPVTEAGGKLFSDSGQARFAGNYPIKAEKNTYLNDSMIQRPCKNNSDCISGNCSEYGYCSPQYKKLIPMSDFFTTDDKPLNNMPRL